MLIFIESSLLDAFLSPLIVFSILIHTFAYSSPFEYAPLSAYRWGVRVGY